MPKIKQQTIDEKYLWIGGGVLTLVIVIFVWGRMSAAKSKGDTSDITPNINPITVTTDSGSISWDPSQLVKEIYTAYKINWSSGRCEVLNKMLDLQDVQLRATADGYHKAYGETLRKTLNDAWVACFFSELTDSNAHNQVIRRLDALGIA